MMLPWMVAIMQNESRSWELLPYQKPYYYSWKLEPDSCSHNVSVSVDILGELDTKIFNQAIEIFIKEHYVLSDFSFVETEAGIRQEYNGHVAVAYQFLIAKTEDDLEKITKELISTPFNLVKPPLIRASLIKKQDKNRFRYVIWGHHIIADTVSGQKCIELVATIYRCLAQNEVLPQPTKNKTLNFFDNYKYEVVKELELETYWNKYLTMPMHMNFGKFAQTTDVCTHVIHLDKKLSKEILHLRDSHEYSAFTVLSCAFSILMHLVHDTNKLMIGYPINARGVKYKNTIGPLFNVHFYSSKISETTTIEQLLNYLQQQRHEAKQFQHIPFQKFIEYNLKGHDLKNTEYPNLCLVETKARTADFSLGDKIKTQSIETDNLGYHHDVVFSYEISDPIRLCWAYKQELFNLDNIKVYQEYLVKILQLIVAHQNEVISCINISNIKLKSSDNLPGLNYIKGKLAQYDCNMIHFSGAHEHDVDALFAYGDYKISKSKEIKSLESGTVYVVFAQEYHNYIEMLSKVESKVVVIIICYVDEVFSCDESFDNVCFIKLLLTYDNKHLGVLNDGQILPTKNLSLERNAIELATNLLLDGKIIDIKVILKTDYKLYLYHSNEQLHYQNVANTALSFKACQFVYLDISQSIYFVYIKRNITSKLIGLTYGIDQLGYQLNSILTENSLSGYIPAVWLNLAHQQENFPLVSQYAEKISLNSGGEVIGDKYINIIKGLWRECIPYKVDTLSIYRPFQQYGIASLASINLLRKINDEIDTNLPISWLLKNNTIFSQAIYLATERQDYADVYEPIIRFKEGIKDNPPLILIHPMFFHGSCYETLAKHIDSKTPVYAINSYNLDTRDDFIKSIEELAAKYVEYILSSIPATSYFIGGWCQGGLIACEIARQLTKKDITVNKLILLDSAKLSRYLAHSISIFARPSVMKRFLTDQSCAFLTSLPQKYQKHIFKVMRLEFAMQAKYSLKKYHGKSILLRAKDPGRLGKYHYSSRLNGFDRSLINCTVFDIDNDHDAMLCGSAKISADIINTELVEQKACATSLL